jgi:polyhydroxyalkanoate synthase
MEPLEKQRLTYFSSQIIDMMSPTNFLATNPDALEKAVATEGQSLIDGLENLISDLEANNGELVVKLADDSAFEIGRNIATTPGKVVFRNKMMELIQYEPTTETVHATPLIIFPPWINKYYILDLKEQNSMVKWLTDQGYTLFIVSWINPDATYRDIGMEDYITDGYLTAFEEVKTITDQKQVNVVGYCIAGTTLSLTLSLMKQRGDTSVKSATFFTALTDFGDQGEFTPFLQNDFIDGIEAEIADKGILPSVVMARTFSFLRSNDLVYTPAIKSYMLGETPPAFDLLYWNGDGANLPGKMAIQYLRGLCQRNELATVGFDLSGHHLVLDEVDVPICAIACETDHIAPWKDSYRGVQKMGSADKTFIMTQSGHIAGIVNPPSKKKYGHYTNKDLTLDHADWLEGAKFHEGSWWPRWDKWLSKQSGKQVNARIPGDSSHPVLCDAPGTYVVVKSSDCK